MAAPSVREILPKSAFKDPKKLSFRPSVLISYIEERNRIFERSIAKRTALSQAGNATESVTLVRSDSSIKTPFDTTLYLLGAMILNSTVAFS